MHIYTYSIKLLIVAHAPQLCEEQPGFKSKSLEISSMYALLIDNVTVHLRSRKENSNTSSLTRGTFSLLGVAAALLAVSVLAGIILLLYVT